MGGGGPREGANNNIYNAQKSRPDGWTWSRRWPDMTLDGSGANLPDLPRKGLEEYHMNGTATNRIKRVF